VIFSHAKLYPMKIILLLFAILTFPIAFAQTDPLPKNNPATQVATPNTGVTDKTVTGQKEVHKIEPEKNAETVEKIEERNAEHKRKTVKKYKGKNSDVSKTQ
jgi:hypothetical protein